MLRISSFDLSFQARVLHELRRSTLTAMFHRGPDHEAIKRDLKFKMLSCSHSIYDMFFSKRKSKLTPKPSLRPDLHSTYRSKCDARTILSVMQDKSKKKGTATIDDKIVDSLPLKMQNYFVANQFYPLYPYFHSYSHSPFPHPPPPCTMLLCLFLFLKDERRNGGSFSILCRIMSRKVAAVHLLRNIKSQITSKWSQLFVALHRKIQSKCVLNLAYLTRVINR